MKKQIQELIEKLSESNIPAFYVDNKKQAFNKVMSMIPQGSVVGLGDSLTLRQIGVVEALTKGNYTFLNPWKPGTSLEESIKVKKRALTSDVFVTGSP